jgi:hypothetical protein
VIHVWRDQALTKGDQGACAERWRLGLETGQHQLPAAIHGCGFDHFVIRDLRICLEQHRQGQLGRGHRRLALWVVFIEQPHLLLKGIGKPFVAMLPQEHKQLGTVDALNDGVFCRRQLDGRMP